METNRKALLGSLVRDSLYPIDERAVADAILMRAKARRVVPDLDFRSEQRRRQVRSFRPHRDARSFRLADSRRRPG